MPRPVHFDIQADDPQRAMKFYQELFGWEFREFMPDFYWLITTGDDNSLGINGGLGKREGAAPVAGAGANAFILTMAVPSLDETMATVKRLGCKITQDKHVIPGVGWFFYFVDTEGNDLGAVQEDPNAA